MTAGQVRHAVDEQALAALREACPDAARRGEPDDAVCGVPAAYVVAPAGTEQAARVMRVAADRGLAVVARGSGTKLRWGAAPARVDVIIDTTRMSSVVEHAAGDLVVTAQAGTDLRTLQDVVGTAGQRLGLDPVRRTATAAAGTVGGVIATGVSGPLRLSHGAVRDLLIGATVVRADGVVTKSGGKVVKNVAGYDLPKLLCGSWGTLGIVTQATFRLHPLPAATRWIVAPFRSAADAGAMARAILHAQLAPAALELDRPAAGDATVAVAVEGTAAGVAARAAAARDLLGGDAAVSDDAPPWCGVAPWPDGGVALRLTTEVTGLPTLLDAVDAAAGAVGARAAVRGSIGVGLLHAALPADTPAPAVAAVVNALRDQAGRWGGQLVILDAPDETRAAIDMWGPARGIALMRRVKDQFDPEHRLSPGRFVGGI